MSNVRQKGPKYTGDKLIKECIVSVFLSISLYAMIILSTGTQSCSWFSNNDNDTTGFPRPYISAHSPAWRPGSSNIIFAYTPLDKSDDTTYIPLTDSSGWWFIDADGENLSFFLYLSCGDLDWHPNGEEIITYAGWGYPSLIKINVTDTSTTEIGYFGEGAFTARYSADGSVVMLFADNGDSEGIWVMDVDGSNARFLLSSSIVSVEFDWAPDDYTIAYEDGSGGLSLIDTNGANIRRLVTEGGMFSSPSFSPNGKKIAFDMRKDVFEDYAIYTINSDGSNLKKLAIGRHPAWSPDDSEIVFTKYSYWGDYDEGNGQLWIMDNNGLNQRQLTFVK